MGRVTSLTLTEDQHRTLKAALFPGDGDERVALLLCGHRVGLERTRIMVRSIHVVEDRHVTSRSAQHIAWSAEAIAGLLDEAERDGLCIFKIHSHPTGYDQFSDTDDQSDRDLFPVLMGAIETAPLHGSALMLENGFIRARVFAPEVRPIDFVAIVGDDIKFYSNVPDSSSELEDCGSSHLVAFGSKTYNQFKRLVIGVVGISGTGSPTLEQVVRLQAGEVMPVDPDHIEFRNLNRVYNSTAEHACRKTLKVEVAAEAIQRMGFGTNVRAIPLNVADPRAVLALAECDIIFGCVDSLEGRDILNLISTYYSIPYFDIGVRIVADSAGHIREACGTVHYVKPGGSSLISRGLFTQEEARADAMRRLDPEAYKEQVGRGYIKGAAERRPAVITLNSALASLATSELLARLNPFREEPNSAYASVTMSLSSMEFVLGAEGEPCPLLARHVGRGDTTPLLRRPALGKAA